MSEPTDFLSRLISLPGLSSYEEPVRAEIARAWQPLVDELTTSRLGSLHGLKRGRGEDPRPSILLSAHMDAIGMIVSRIEQGLLRFTQIGGIDPRILPGQLVTVHGRRALPGVIAAPPARLLPEGSADKTVEMEYLLVDTGLLEEEVRQLVRPGDLISFAQPPLELPGDVLVGHSLDNRASVAALTVCLEELQHMHTAWDVWAVASVQEEVALLGGYTSAFELHPDLAIAIDVTFAKGPGASDYNTFQLGKGVPLGWGPNVHPGIFRRLKSLAERLDIPWHLDVMPTHSGTDAYAMQVAAEGIPTAVISVPLRYMHTPVEMISRKDVQRTGRLLAELVTTLEPDFLQNLRWDEEE